MAMPTATLLTHQLPFPAVVTAPDGRFWPMARLLVVGGEVVVFEFTDRVKIAATIQIGGYTLPGPRRQGETQTWRVTEPEVGDWIITRGNGCGCGHPLKRANLQRILNAR